MHSLPFTPIFYTFCHHTTRPHTDEGIDTRNEFPLAHHIPAAWHRSRTYCEIVLVVGGFITVIGVLL